MPISSLQRLSAEVLTTQTDLLVSDLSVCPFHLCDLLLDCAINHGRVLTFQNILRQWPHPEAAMTLKPQEIKFLQTVALLEHQGQLSGQLHKLWIYAPYAGYVTTSSLCATAVGIPPPQEPPFKRARLTPSRKLSIYTPLNLNSSTISNFLRYLETPPERRAINLVPTALTFTSLPAISVFKVLRMVDHSHLGMLGIDFCLHPKQNLDHLTDIHILSSLTTLQSLSLNYNHLSGREREGPLIAVVQSLPNLVRVNLCGNRMKHGSHLYTNARTRELLLGNTYPCNESLTFLGAYCGKSLVYLKLSDNGLGVRLAGLTSLLAKCEQLTALDISGNEFHGLAQVRSLLRALSGVERTLRHLDISKNMMVTEERAEVIEHVAQFAQLRTLVLGCYLPELMVSDIVLETERGLMSEVWMRPDVAMNPDETGLTLNIGAF